jgi:hypothetical protein
MNSLAENITEQESLAKKVWLTDDMINLELIDGRVVSVPLVFYPSLADATKEHRDDFRIFSEGSAIHFNHLDIDLSVDSLVMGRKEIPGLMNKFKKLEEKEELPLK